jgi:hypothetical protein
MDAFVIDRTAGREDGEDWTDDYQSCPAARTSRSSSNPPRSPGSGLGCTSIPTPKPSSSVGGGRRSPSVPNNCGVTPDKFSSFHPILRTSSNTPHKFETGPDGYEGVHIHANARFITEWLE